MKKILILVMVFISSLAIAQRGGGALNPKKMVAKQHTEVKERISTLSETQKASLKEIYDVYEKSLTAALSQSDRQEKMASFMKAESDKDESIQKVLDEEQLKIYEKLKDEWKAKRKQKMTGRRNG
jgi:N-acetylmuramic acid 6-phosphate (MurNAc-6-P) etherase